MSTILIVEDEQEVRNTVAEFLKYEGFSVAEASNGEEAISYLANNIPDLIISDIMMPKVDGFRLLEFIKNNHTTDSIPFIMLTAKTEYSSIREGMNMGADDYICKPFRLNDLKSAIKSRLRKKEIMNRNFEKVCVNISSSVPHELLTPLIPIMGYPDIIAEDYESYTKEQILQIFQQIKSAGIRLHKTISKFLRFADLKIKISEQNYRHSIEHNHSTYFCGTLLKSILNQFEDKERSEDLVYDINETYINIPLPDFEFILGEIISNAFKFSKPGKKVSITGHNSTAEYFITITDNGCGMTSEQVQNIKPFLSFSEAKYNLNGLGLGLSTVMYLLDYYKGEIKIESAIDKGTTCLITVPLANQVISSVHS